MSNQIELHWKMLKHKIMVNNKFLDEGHSEEIIQTDECKDKT